VAGRGRDEALDAGRAVEDRQLVAGGGLAQLADEGVEARRRGGDQHTRGARARDAEGLRHAARRVEGLARPEHGLAVAGVDRDLALDDVEALASSWWTCGGGWWPPKEPGRTRPRTVYELTDAGLAALREWAATPVAFPRIQNEPILRVLAADLVGGGRALEGLRALRADLDAIDGDLDTAEEIARGLPHRERYLMLNHRLARSLVAAHREWLDEAERTLGEK
jgi:hypothetical protein